MRNRASGWLRRQHGTCFVIRLVSFSDPTPNPGTGNAGPGPTFFSRDGGAHLARRRVGE